jgi:hypothetical protein
VSDISNHSSPSGESGHDQKAISSRRTRKIHAYHVFIQAGIIAKGLLHYLSVEFPTLVWESFGSWLRTIRPGIPPSELIVGHVMRETISDFLVNCAKSNSLAKFIVERQDTDNLRLFRRAS